MDVWFDIHYYYQIIQHPIKIHLKKTTFYFPCDLCHFHYCYYCCCCHCFLEERRHFSTAALSLGPIYYVDLHLLRRFFWKINISYPLILTHTCANQRVRNINFSKNFAYALNQWPPSRQTAERKNSSKEST